MNIYGNASIEHCPEHTIVVFVSSYQLAHFKCNGLRDFVSAGFITGLLQNIGTHVDPIVLIQQIRTGMEIPGLRDSLVKILQDYNLQVTGENMSLCHSTL